MTGKTPPVVVIAAVARNRVIGDGETIPWRLSTDLKRFRALTLHRPVIMGRRTFLSLGRPLPERTNVVLSADPAFAPAGVVMARSFEEALEAARRALDRTPPPAGVAEEIAVAGGAAVYAAALPVARRLEITRVETEPAGAVRFPEVDWSAWRRLAREPHPAGPRDDHPFVFETWERAA